ncbi:MAG: hypothetical protein ACJ73D_05960 [Pyrinomonadaceae bacterium]
MATQNNQSTAKGSAGGADQAMGAGAGASRSTGSTGTGASTPNVQDVKAGAQSILEQTKSTVGEVYETVSEKAVNALDEKKSGLSDGLSSAADTVRRFSSTLNESDSNDRVTELASKYSETAAQKLESAGRYLESTDWRQLTQDVEVQARRNPAVFLGTAFALGILAARFLKSSPPASTSISTGTRSNRLNAANKGQTHDLGNTHAAM